MGHSNGRSRLLKAEDRKGNKIMGDAMEFSCSRRERGDRVKRSGGGGVVVVVKGLTHAQ